jgi:hypothetical protein
MIANISAKDSNNDETISTLRFAGTVATVTNKPIKNEDADGSQLQTYQDEIARLKAELEKSKSDPLTEPEEQAVLSARMQEIMSSLLYPKFVVSAALKWRSNTIGLVKKKELTRTVSDLTDTLKSKSTELEHQAPTLPTGPRVWSALPSVDPSRPVSRRAFPSWIVRCSRRATTRGRWRGSWRNPASTFTPWMKASKNE